MDGMTLLNLCEPYPFIYIQSLVQDGSIPNNLMGQNISLDNEMNSALLLFRNKPFEPYGHFMLLC